MSITRDAVRSSLSILAILAALAAAAPAEHAAAQGRTYSANELTTPPSVRSKGAAAAAIESSLPSQLASVGGKVQLRFVVTEQGKVEPGSIEVLAASAKVLGEAATRAVQRIEFVPGKVDGTPVRALVAFPITYSAQ